MPNNQNNLSDIPHLRDVDAWPEWDRLAGEFLRTWETNKELRVFENLGKDKQRLLGGFGVHRWMEDNKKIRNLLSHGAVIHITKNPDDADWVPTATTINFAAQMFLGINPVQLKKDRRDFSGRGSSAGRLKRGIAQMCWLRRCLDVSFEDGAVKPRGGHKLLAVRVPDEWREIPHVSWVFDRTQQHRLLMPRYDDTHAKTSVWRDLDMSTGMLLREWSSCLCCLRQLELMRNNPRPNSYMLNIESELTDVKRAAKVLANEPKLLRRVEAVAREKNMILHAPRRFANGKTPVVEDVKTTRILRSSGLEGAAVLSVENIRKLTNTVVIPVAKELEHLVDALRKTWPYQGPTAEDWPQTIPERQPKNGSDHVAET